jgi:hypothetical protein
MKSRSARESKLVFLMLRIAGDYVNMEALSKISMGNFGFCDWSLVLRRWSFAGLRTTHAV